MCGASEANIRKYELEMTTKIYKLEKNGIQETEILSLSALNKGYHNISDKIGVKPVTL